MSDHPPAVVAAPRESGLLKPNNDRVEVFTIMRALDPEVVEVIWRAVKPLIPVHTVTHPLGCHRQRASDRACFAVILVRLATGCSWEDAERLCGNEVSDTTVRDRRDEWIDAGVFDAIANEAIGGYDRVIGLDLSDVSVDGSLHKAPAGGEGTGPNPTDRGKLGWKWSILTDRYGIPLGWTIDGANRNDSILLAPDPRQRRRARPARRDRHDVVRPRLRQQRHPGTSRRTRHRRRDHRQETPTTLQPTKDEPANGSALARRAHELVAVELRSAPPNTDRRSVHRLAQFALSVADIAFTALSGGGSYYPPISQPQRGGRGR